jgi:GxxExxY protein
MSPANANARDQQTHAIIGAAMEVHRQLGPGFLEAVYQEALALEFTAQGIPFVPQVELSVHYKGQKLVSFYRTDFICYENVIVELKALKVLTSIEEAQLLNYLKATHLERSLLLNFGSPSLEFKRFVFSNQRKQASDPQITQIYTD